MKIKKILELNFFNSILRMLKFKIFNYNNLKLNGLKYYFGKNTNISLSEEGRIFLEDKIFFSKNTDIEAVGGIVKIGFNTFFNNGCKIVALEKIEIGENCIFGDSVSIYDHDHKFKRLDIPFNKQGFSTKQIKIGDNVWIGAKVTILKGVSIGSNSIIAANVAVIRDVPENTIFYGSKYKKIVPNFKENNK